MKKEMAGWSNLSKEEQVEVREAMRSAWSDPVVINARANVNKAAHEYQKAIRETIGKRDPEIRKLLDKLQKSESGLVNTAMGGSGGRINKHIHAASVNRLSQMIAPPGMLEKMSPEQKAEFNEVASKAKRQPEVVQAIEDLKSLAAEDEKIRKKKIEAYRKFRKAYFDAIVEIDPEFKNVIPPLNGPHPYHGKGKSKGKSGRKIIAGDDLPPPN